MKSEIVGTVRCRSNCNISGFFCVKYYKKFIIIDKKTLRRSIGLGSNIKTFERVGGIAIYPGFDGSNPA